MTFISVLEDLQSLASVQDCWPTDGADGDGRAATSHEDLLPARKALSSYLVMNSQNPREAAGISPTFQMKKSRPSELKATAQGQEAGKWQSRALVPTHLAPQPQLPATQLDIQRQQANVSRPGILLRNSR